MKTQYWILLISLLVGGRTAHAQGRLEIGLQVNDSIISAKGRQHPHHSLGLLLPTAAPLPKGTLHYRTNMGIYHSVDYAFSNHFSAGIGSDLITTGISLIQGFDISPLMTPHVKLGVPLGDKWYLGTWGGMATILPFQSDRVLTGTLNLTYVPKPYQFFNLHVGVVDIGYFDQRQGLASLSYHTRIKKKFMLESELILSADLNPLAGPTSGRVLGSGALRYLHHQYSLRAGASLFAGFSLGGESPELEIPALPTPFIEFSYFLQTKKK
ncbi:MAG: hypothetical protein AAGM67_00845 [Bacteroidota bacterium]